MKIKQQKMSLNEHSQKEVKKLTNKSHYHWYTIHIRTLISCYNDFIIFFCDFIREWKVGKNSQNRVQYNNSGCCSEDHFSDPSVGGSFQRVADRNCWVLIEKKIHSECKGAKCIPGQIKPNYLEFLFLGYLLVISWHLIDNDNCYISNDYQS